jgi:hypothetical protein
MAIQPGVGYTFNASSQGTNLAIEKPWAPWAAYPAEEPEEPCAPFKVKNVKEVTVESTFVTYDICPGTINNLMPQVYNESEEAFEYLDDLTAGYQLILDFDGTSSSLVYLRVGPDATTKAFPPGAPIGTSDPDDPYPRIYNTGGALPADTDTLAYLLIAKVNALGDGVYSVDQYVTGSLWADRIKLEGITAKYFYARI